MVAVSATLRAPRARATVSRHRGAYRALQRRARPPPRRLRPRVPQPAGGACSSSRSRRSRRAGPMALDELVERHARGAPTGGLFAITFDDGVGEHRARDRRGAVDGARQWPVSVLSADRLPRRASAACRSSGCGRHRAPHAPARKLELAGETSGLLGAATRSAPSHEGHDAAHVRAAVAEYGPRLRGHRGAALVERGLVDPGALTPPAAITWAEGRDAGARRSLVSFESHGITHTAVAALHADEREHELVASQRAIAEHTGRALPSLLLSVWRPRASIGDVARHASPATIDRRRRWRVAVSVVTRCRSCRASRFTRTTTRRSRATLKVLTA